MSVSLVMAVMWVESRYNPNAASRAGAIGLMQLMPRTAKGLGVNPYDPAENVKGGIAYLAQLNSRFDCSELALAGYNAGPGVVGRTKRVPPYIETQKFIERVQREESIWIGLSTDCQTTSRQKQ